MRIHNRHLPPWIHCIANGVMAALGLALVGSVGSGFVPGGSLAWKAAILLLLFSAPMGVLVALLVDPRKFSLVEGVAGDDGYDELEAEKPDPGTDRPL
jgi:hypothetical protein